MSDKLPTLYDDKMTWTRRYKNLPHQPRHQRSHLHLRNNPYREGHPRSCGECPRMSFLLMGYPYIFCVVSLCLGSYVQPPLKGVYHNGASFFYVFVILMTAVMESNKVTVIMVIAWIKANLKFEIYKCNSENFLDVVNKKDTDVAIFKQLMDMGTAGQAELTASKESVTFCHL